MDEPLTPQGITGRELDRSVQDELRSLSRETAERVAAHLVAAWALVDVDSHEAFLHAKFAARRGGRIGSVRETYGVVAYQAGEYATALRELRTALRITGRSDLLPMIADCERGLGRPERAFDIAASPEAEKLDLNGTIEMMIVVAGAYADTGDISTALSTLEIPALRQKVDGAWHVRLWVAYADLLERAGRDDEARRWLSLAADADTEQITDAGRRMGRPAPVEPDPTWEDDETVSVLDALVELTEDDPESVSDADKDDDTDVDNDDADDTDVDDTDVDDADVDDDAVDDDIDEVHDSVVEDDADEVDDGDVSAGDVPDDEDSEHGESDDEIDVEFDQASDEDSVDVSEVEGDDFEDTDVDDTDAENSDADDTDSEISDSTSDEAGADVIEEDEPVTSEEDDRA